MSERSIFLEAMDIDDPSRRAAFLDAACAGDAVLRGRVEELLLAHQRPDGFMQRPAPAVVTTLPVPAEAPGAVIAGRYKLLESIGEGGMGEVWVAEQLEPIRRRVALKLIKPGMDSRQVLARFEAERQALALMDHPNIAKVFDGGATALGRPYFVMELVKSTPITTFCDENQLSVRERLGLFLDVCAAVQHAHQKGVIHRDIKPSNVLVRSHDGTPVVKVIDFGVAKAIDQRLTELTVYTQLTQLVGTPLYMSPEQAGQSGLDVDTRTDIYALGVLLYELLTGLTPFDGERLRTAGIDEFRRIIREEEPAKPSTRLSTLGQAAETVSTNRRVEPKELRRLVRGELDWIVMKALEKDRNRRYDTASALAADVRRYLADEPVVAGPPGRGYRMRKFVRRNRLALVATAVVATALVAGAGVAAWQAVVATRARSDALTAAEQEKAATQAAQAREAETRAIIDFVQTRILAAARPKGQQGGLGRDVSLRTAIDEGVRYIDTSFSGQPLVEARLRMTLGTSYWYLGDATAAAGQFRKARELYTRLVGPDDPDTLMCANRLANCYFALGRFPEARDLHERTLAVRQATLGDDHEDTIASRINLANSLSALNESHRALEMRESTLALVQNRFGPNHPDTFLCMSNLANSYETFNETQKVLDLRERALAGRAAHPQIGPDHPDTLQSMNNLAVTYNALDRHGEALKLREEVLARRQKLLGADHPDTLNSMHNVAFSYAALKQHGRALETRLETLKLRKAHPEIGPTHPDTLRSMHALALSYSALGRHAEALTLHEETLALRKVRLSPDHHETLKSMQEVAACLVALDRGAKAIAHIDECVRRAAAQGIVPNVVADAMDLRLRHFAKADDAGGCRVTAEMWERLNRSDADSLFRAARFRAVTARVLAPDRAAAEAEARLAMGWLQKAVEGGYRDVERLKTDPDLAVLRGRDDYKQLLARTKDGRK